MIYRILWFSVIHQQESAIGIHMSPPFPTSLPSPSSPHPSACHRAPEFPESYSKFPLAIYFTYGIINFYVTFSIHIPFSFPLPTVSHRSVLYVCISICALKTNSSVPSLQIPYICVSIWYLCFSFWLISLYFHPPH